MQIHAQHPYGTGSFPVEISDKEIEILQKRGPLSRYMELASAIETLQKPAIIFENLMRNGFEHALCYTGRPTMFAQQTEYPTPKGLVFTVYINRKYILYEWRLEQEDPDYPNHPLGWKARFGQKKWPTSQ